MFGQGFDSPHLHMTKQQAEELLTHFVNKAATPGSLMAHSKIVDNHGLSHGGYSIFDGEQDDSKKIASIAIKSNLVDDISSVTLYIGNNQYEFIDNPEFCKEVMDRFVKKPEKKILKLNLDLTP